MGESGEPLQVVGFFDEVVLSGFDGWEASVCDGSLDGVPGWPAVKGFGCG